MALLEEKYENFHKLQVISDKESEKFNKTKFRRNRKKNYSKKKKFIHSIEQFIQLFNCFLKKI